jgi:hypothetical protein
VLCCAVPARHLLLLLLLLLSLLSLLSLLQPIKG